MVDRSGGVVDMWPFGRCGPHGFNSHCSRHNNNNNYNHDQATSTPRPTRDTYHAVSALPTPAATTPVKPFAVRPSPTDDMGAFATRALLPNEVILDGKRFPYN
ncbi:hypothetical protein MY10362_009535 [Beauveria mimosiformis]